MAIPWKTSPPLSPFPFSLSLSLSLMSSSYVYNTIIHTPTPPSSMASLQDLLAQDGFRRPGCRTPNKPIDPSLPSVSLCGDRKSVDVPDRLNGSSSFASGRTSLHSIVSKPSSLPDPEEPLIDDAAIGAVVSVLSGYVGRFLKDVAFRRRVREKCAACVAAARKGAAHAVLANLELGIESIERLAEDPPGESKDSKVRSLRNSIRLLSVVASLSSPKSRKGYTCGVPNAHLSACAQLYLAVVYKIERNDRVAARHLLQVFCNAPLLARKSLLLDLWEHFFMPHLLHLKVWYDQETQLVASWNAEEKEQRMRSLNRLYNDQIDMGTSLFAHYYKDWLKVGGKAPAVPSVPLPSRPDYLESWQKRSVLMPRKTLNQSLYQAVFGPLLEQEDVSRAVLMDHTNLNVEKDLDSKEGTCKLEKFVHSDMGVDQRPADLEEWLPILASAPMLHKKSSFRFFSCRGDTIAGPRCHVKGPKRESAATVKEPLSNPSLVNHGGAIALISNSDSLIDCEAAIHVVAKSWLESHGDTTIEKALSKSSVIEGLLQVSFTSKDDEILELAISLLANLVVRSEVNRQVVLNLDPQLEVFLRLLRSKNLFLKAAVLLHLLKPKAKQMLSFDWIPLVLHVLEHGDQPQTFFTIQCSSQSAAFYFLDQLLRGFDVDRNEENVKQMVTLGGLGLLLRTLETCDAGEKKSAALLLVTCVRADGGCRNYLVENMKKQSLIELFVGNRFKSSRTALSLLTELVRLDRRTQIINFLHGLKNEGCLNIMHILLVYLHQAPLDQRPLAAAILLQLDLLGARLQYSVYREEGIDAIISALEHNLDSEKVQEQSSRALLLLAGRFSSIGEAMSEAWLLKRAGLDDGTAFCSKDLGADEYARMEEEEKATEVWLENLANALIHSGSHRFLVALSNCIAGGIPRLARSCLVTIAWMSNSLSSLKNAYSLQSFACSILVPRLVESLRNDRALEDRVLASFSLLNFVRHSGCLSKLFPLDRETVRLLQDLAQVTWAAKELLCACCR